MSDAAEILFVGGGEVGLDGDGFLVDAARWTPEVADLIAARDGVELGPDHWWLIGFVREYYGHYGNPPLMRVTVAAWRERYGEGSSRDLYQLFPDGPIRLACKYGGLPKPDWCI